MYPILRPLLFQLDAERAHALLLVVLRIAQRLHLHRLAAPVAGDCTIRLMGLDFQNRVGLAAGFDKNGTCIDALGALGFGFLEIGTVTPQAQTGNPCPRIFRLPKAQAIINRMGFPNDGAAATSTYVKQRHYRGICGINIGKNAATPMERAVDDYVACLRAVYAAADYVAVNISSPNTADLRHLQESARLEPLLAALLEVRESLKQQYDRYVPLVVKLSPDLSDDELAGAAHVLKSLHIDGVIATNSTIQRPAVVGLRHAEQVGGLSGAPLHTLSIAVIRKLRGLLGPAFPIIGAGGIYSADAAQETFAAGAQLIQIYSGLVYDGPGFVRELRKVA